MDKVMILLSTYNGEKYIEQQIESILKQDYPNIDVLVRDDGSTDNTVEILNKYSKIYENIKFYTGKNIGTCDSFFDLIRNASNEYEYYAFADQDDYWLINKVSIAVSSIENNKNNEPILYCSNVILVDENLNKLPSVVRRGNIKASFGNALIEDICTGCTCLINSKMFLLIKEHIPRYAIMHDWWFYLVATCFGKVIYDKNSYIWYRQHKENVIGAPTSYFNLYKKRLHNFKKNKRKISKQVVELNIMFEIQGYNKILINYIIESQKSIKYRLKIFFSKNIFRQNKIDNILLKFIILFRGC